MLRRQGEGGKKKAFTQVEGYRSGKGNHKFSWDMLPSAARSQVEKNSRRRRRLRTSVQPRVIGHHTMPAQRGLCARGGKDPKPDKVGHYVRTLMLLGRGGQNETS